MVNHSKETSIFLLVSSIKHCLQLPFRQLSGFCHPIPRKHCSGNVALRSRFQIALHLEQDQTEHGNAPIIASLISDRCTWPITAGIIVLTVQSANHSAIQASPPVTCQPVHVTRQVYLRPLTDCLLSQRLVKWVTFTWFHIIFHSIINYKYTLHLIV